MKPIEYSEMKYLLSVYEVSRVLGVSTHTVYKLINCGKLKCKKISPRRTLIPSEEITRYIEEH